MSQSTQSFEVVRGIFVIVLGLTLLIGLSLLHSAWAGIGFVMMGVGGIVLTLDSPISEAGKMTAVSCLLVGIGFMLCMTLLTVNGVFQC